MDNALGLNSTINALIQSCYENAIDKELAISPLLRDAISDRTAMIKTDIRSIDDLMTALERVAVEDDPQGKGTVFTPSYIADYITSDLRYTEEIKVLDPSCGSGAFLISALKRLAEYGGVSPISIVNKNLCGIEINEEYARCCKLILELVCLSMDCPTDRIQPNIVVGDALKIDWEAAFGGKFDYIEGNPPYVRIHRIDDKEYYEGKFDSATGMYNLASLFLEKSLLHLKPSGTAAFITINNLFTNKFSEPVRKKIAPNLKRVVDFMGNEIFAAQTRSCIIEYKGEARETYEYMQIPESENVKERLNSAEFKTFRNGELLPSGWIFADDDKMKQIAAIERFPLKLGKYITSGIATLADDIYTINDQTTISDSGAVYEIEPEITKNLYKASDYKKSGKAGRIIFPYKKANGVYTALTEEELAKYPNAYGYLLDAKDKLTKRDIDKGSAWFEYGRNQNINGPRSMIAFCRYANKPWFAAIEDRDGVITGGYVITEDIPIETDILLMVLNSEIMDFYVRSTSYPIKGGYYNYGKKYLANFSIPEFSESEKAAMRKMNEEELNKFLNNKYKE